MKKLLIILLTLTLLSGCAPTTSGNGTAEKEVSAAVAEQPIVSETEAAPTSQAEIEEALENNHVSIGHQVLQGSNDVVYFIQGGLFQYMPASDEVTTLYEPETTDPLAYCREFFLQGDTIYLIIGKSVQSYDLTTNELTKLFELNDFSLYSQLLDQQLIVEYYVSDTADVEYHAYDLSDGGREMPMDEVQGIWLGIDATTPEHPTMTKHQGDNDTVIDETYYYSWNGIDLFYSSDVAGRQIYRYNLITEQKESFAKMEQVVTSVMADDTAVYTTAQVDAGVSKAYRFNRADKSRDELPDDFITKQDILQIGDYLYGVGGYSDEAYVICMGPDGNVRSVDIPEIPPMKMDD